MSLVIAGLLLCTVILQISHRTLTKTTLLQAVRRISSIPTNHILDLNIKASRVSIISHIEVATVAGIVVTIIMVQIGDRPDLDLLHPTRQYIVNVAEE